ncbi:recombinase RecT [Caenibacillus caldisaponilyticus]|uniref:recombinase RecT n=1 Tax=Caenibacillus caldisaponilyticus TaxID=1674942 RepID=UPI001EE6F182|nr:RecT family recombinase [Caenibacillus caldisaponilyticus]
MKSAWLILQSTVDRNKRPALEVCTRDSVANALLDMVIQGLNPAKKQCYFVVFGNQLICMRSYFGTMAVTKRVTGAKEINANVIYEGDEVEYEIKNARIVNLVHKQKFGNINKDKIIGAYATIVMPDGEAYYEVMTMDEIRKAWSKSQMWGKDQNSERKGSTHDEFRQEMAKKTVINRACKKFVNSSDDSSLVISHFNRQDEVIEEAEAEEEIKKNANREVIDIDYEEVPEDPQQIDGQQQQPEEREEEHHEQLTLDATGTEGPGF